MAGKPYKAPYCKSFLKIKLPFSVKAEVAVSQQMKSLQTVLDIATHTLGVECRALIVPHALLTLPMIVKRK